MTSTNPWVKRAAVAVAAFAVLGAASPAFAATAEVTGARATTNSADTVVTVTDTRANGNSASAEFYVNGSNSMRTITATKGNNTSVSSGEYDDGIEKLRACNIRPIVPDNCSSWTTV